MDLSSSTWFFTQRHLLLIAATLTAASAAVLVIFEICLLFCQKYCRAVPPATSSGCSWPPSPPALPILGHLHLVKANVHLAMYNLSLKYGPLYHLRFANIHALIISSSNMAKLVLKTHDRSFASRASSGSAIETFSHNFQDLAGAPYGPHWRHMRKLCMSEVFSIKRIESFSTVRNDEVASLVKTVFNESSSGKPLEMSVKLGQLMLNIISLMTMGKSLIPWGSEQNGQDEELKNFLFTVKEMFVLSGVVNNIGDHFPWLRWLDLQGYERRIRNASKSFDNFVLKQIERKRKQPSSDSSRKDLLDILLTLPSESDGKLSDDVVLGLMLDILSAGVDTSGSTVEWALTELVKHPAVLEKLQAEIDDYVGTARTLQECDLTHLPYLEAVAKETLRLHPPAPLLLPHETIEPCKLLNYDIPEKTRAFINVWAIGRDPAEWERPLEFTPERFIGIDADPKGQDFRFLPFGSGRRSCPGISLGLVVVQLTIGRLVHSFDLALPPWQKAEDVDMGETFGLTVMKTVPLQLMAAPRLPLDLYN